MSKTVVGENCRIKTLPQGGSAKVDGKGNALITLTAAVVETSAILKVLDSESAVVTKKISIGGFEAESYDGTNYFFLIGDTANFDETGFYDF